MFIYCKHKSTVVMLLTLQVLHTLPSTTKHFLLCFLKVMCIISKNVSNRSCRS